MQSNFGFSDIFRIEPTLAATAYAVGDAMGTAGALTITNPMRNRRSAILYTTLVHDYASQSAALDILLFRATPATSTIDDHDPISISDADNANLIGVIRVAALDYIDLIASAVAQVSTPTIIAPGVEYKDLYAVIRCNGAGTYTADDLDIDIVIMQDEA